MTITAGDLCWDELPCELHNKCDECCPVIFCDTCGPCPCHDTTVIHLLQEETNG